MISIFYIDTFNLLIPLGEKKKSELHSSDPFLFLSLIRLRMADSHTEELSFYEGQ